MLSRDHGSDRAQNIDQDEKDEANRYGFKREPDDHFSKHQKVGYNFQGGADGHVKLIAWQDKTATHLSSKPGEVARWLC